MDEYISREAVVRYLKGYSEKELNKGGNFGMITSSVLDKAERAISEMPSADVQPVKHGRWIDFPECLEYEGALDEEYFVCSECHHVWNTIDNCAETFRYYPNCGSKNEDGDSE